MDNSENQVMQVGRHNILHHIRKKLGKVKRKLFKTNEAYWYSKHLGEEVIIRIREEPGLRVEFYGYAETINWIRKYYKEFPWIYNPKEVKCAEKYNHFYPSLKYNDKVVGFIKIAIVRAYIEDYEDEISLADDEAFIYDTFILPEFRKKRMGSFMLFSILNELKKKNFLFAFCHIPNWNCASCKLYQGMGFKRISYIRYIRLFRFRYFSAKPDTVKKKARRESGL